jgi:hypothetical protein
MTELRNVLKIDLDSLSGFQKNLHLTLTDEEEMDARFSHEFNKTSWSTHAKVAMSRSDGEMGKIVFTANKKYDFLFNCEMRTLLPETRVKDKWEGKVQICWPAKVGHNLIVEGQLLIDDDPINSIDNVWLDIYSQFYADPGQGKRDTYNQMIGNIGFLTSWNNYLPEFPITIRQPWFYCMHESRALPLLQSSMNDIKHIYTLRTNIKDMLRMRIKDKDGKFREIKYNGDYLENPKNIPTPELWGRFSQITDAERDWHKTLDRTLYINDVISAKSDNPKTFGQKENVKLHALTPCKAIFWVGENCDASGNRNFSNYTTNTDDIKQGWNPCETASISYGGSNRVPELPSDHFDASEPMNFFPSCPEEAGYNAYSFAYDSTSLHADTAIVLEGLNASLGLKLGNTNPFRDSSFKDTVYDVDNEAIPVEALDDGLSSSSPKFNVHVKMLVIKKLQIVWNQDREKINYHIVDDATEKK